MTVLHWLRAARGQSDKREEVDSWRFILQTAAVSQPAPQILAVCCAAAGALSPLPEIHSPWLQPSRASPAWPPALFPICG